MVFTTALFCQILLAATALAIPSSNERLAARVQRRAAGSHLSRPMNLVDSVSTFTSGGSVFHDNKTSDNWSGAVLLADTVSDTFDIIPREEEADPSFLVAHFQVCDGHLHRPHALEPLGEPRKRRRICLGWY